MKKLLIALGAFALSTGAVAQHYDHGHNRYHYDHRNHHNNGIRFGIFINPSPYRLYTGYYGPVWPTYGGYIGCTQYNRAGVLVNRYNEPVRYDEYYNRATVRCATNYYNN